MKISVWIAVSVLGLSIIIFQFLLPDLVPNTIDKALSQDNSQYVGVDILLKVALIVYLFVGYILFIGGIVASFISYKRC